MNSVFDTELKRINQWYASLEANFCELRDVEREQRELSDRLTNCSVPIHSWFTLKESFASRFPTWAIQKLQQDYDFHPRSVLDPFIGSGTTAVSLTREGINTEGVEYNPFIRWTAEVKAQWQTYDPGAIAIEIEQIELELPERHGLALPRLSTFHNSEYFRKEDIFVLLHVLAQIDHSSATDNTKNFLKLGVARAVSEVTPLRKDGRALRFVPGLRRLPPQQAIKQMWSQGLQGLQAWMADTDLSTLGTCSIWAGSATDLSGLSTGKRNGTVGLEDDGYDLIMYSPPYLNNFDYSEIYKLELWLLGFVKTYERWRSLKRGSLRSHHSVAFPETDHLAHDPNTADFAVRLEELVKSPLLNGRAREHMPSVIRGYFDDMFVAFREQYRVLRPGGFLIYLVGNSRHKQLPVATDLMLGEIARRVGFTPLELLVLHRRNGRPHRDEYQRESVAIFRKPG